ncbi:hypothetical protein ADICYQ_1159 [Cyclobacterium qasimii M12-11B]|nr:hypothetical protein ADICYQ_1159 [Cyclobacterium qasimii M12-11B]
MQDCKNGQPYPHLRHLWQKQGKLQQLPKPPLPQVPVCQAAFMGGKAAV